MSFFNFLKKNDDTKWFRLFDHKEDTEKNIELNNAITVQIENIKICVARTPKGYFAVSDECPHQGVSLSKGMCTIDNEIKCPVHGYKFDLKTGKETGDRDSDLKVYKVELRKNGLFIGIPK